MNWEVGAKVINGENLDEVIKVYKNGNVVLRSERNQQWRTHGDSAAQTGRNGGWHRPRVVFLATPERLEELRQLQCEKARKRELRSLCDRLVMATQGAAPTPSDNVMQAARALLAALDEGKEE